MTDRCSTCGSSCGHVFGCTGDVREFDPSKPVKTRDGAVAQIERTDLKTSGGETILATITGRDGFERSYTFFPSGNWHESGVNYKDLVNVRVTETVKIWVVMFSGGTQLNTWSRTLDSEPPAGLLNEVGRKEVKIEINR